MAAGLSDIDDRFSVRILNLFYTYLGFFITAVAVYLLFPYPLLFASALIVSCIVLILLGSRSTLCHDFLWLSGDFCLFHAGVELFDGWYQQASLLLIGAVWYGFCRP